MLASFPRRLNEPLCIGMGHLPHSLAWDQIMTLCSRKARAHATTRIGVSVSSSPRPSSSVWLSIEVRIICVVGLRRHMLVFHVQNRIRRKVLVVAAPLHLWPPISAGRHQRNISIPKVPWREPPDPPSRGDHIAK